MAVVFEAIATETIPAYRLLCLVRPEGADDDKIYIRLAKPDERPDFYSLQNLQEGQTVTVRITENKIWQVAVAEYIPAGTSVATCTEEKGFHMSNAVVDANATVGYTLQAAKAGEVVKFVHIYKLKSWKLTQEGDRKSVGVGKECRSGWWPWH